MPRNKIFTLTAAGLFLLSLLFPYWIVMMSAPTYPERNLAIRVYAYKFSGDMAEWNRVGRLVGTHVPPPIPDIVFVIVPVAVVGLAVISLIAAFREELLAAAAVGPLLVLGLLTGWAQYSLYLFGHTLDPKRPLRYIQPFTPPVIGTVTIGKIKTYHFPWIGAVVFGLGAALTLLAWWITRKEAEANVAASDAG